MSTGRALIWLRAIVVVPLLLASFVEERSAAQTFESVEIGFRHQASKTSEKYLIETMGAGVALLDYDGDGLLDIYLVNGAKLSDPMPTGAVPDKSDPIYWNRLYRNLGNWRFEDVTREAGVAGTGYGMGATAADYDNDGDPDLFVTNFGPDTLFRNRGDGTFEDVSRNAGIRGNGWSSGAAFVDVDRDGRLDLFVAGYLDWTFQKNRPCGDFLPKRRSYCHPRFFDAVAHTLYRNLGDGKFSNISSELGLDKHRGKGLGVALGDYDQDGWIDLFVANDSVPQQLFRNAKGHGLEEVAVEVGAAYDSDGRTFAGMGVSWTDYDRDGRADLLINALGRQGYWLYRNVSGEFEVVSEPTGLASLSALRSGWGLGLIDLDNDGWRDLFVGQGHVMDDIIDSDPELAYREPFLLARNLFGRFFDVAPSAGDIFKREFAARGVAFGDLNNDGLTDIVLNNNDDKAVVLRNTSQSAGRYIDVLLSGTIDNRDGIGATVSVRTSAGTVQTSLHSGAGSYLSSSSTDLHFGLGKDESCENVTVRWPNGSTQKIDHIGGTTLRIRQPSRRQLPR